MNAAPADSPMLSGTGRWVRSIVDGRERCLMDGCRKPAVAVGFCRRCLETLRG